MKVQFVPRLLFFHSETVTIKTFRLLKNRNFIYCHFQFNSFRRFSMYFTINAEDNKFFILCDGSLNAVAVEEFRNTVEPFIRDYRAPVVIDLDKVDYVSSAGIRAFLLLFRAAMAKSPEVGVHFMDMVSIINISPQVQQILDISGLSDSIRQWSEERDSLH